MINTVSICLDAKEKRNGEIGICANYKVRLNNTIHTFSHFETMFIDMQKAKSPLLSIDGRLFRTKTLRDCVW